MIYYKKKTQQNVGATAIEYGILSGLIAVATITGLQLTGVKLDNTYCIVASTLAGGGGCSSSANKSASSANGSSSDSGANSSADSSNSSSSSDSSSSADSSTPIYNASNSYSIRDEYAGYGPNDGSQSENILDFAAQHGITEITGLFDQYGNDIKTPSQLASMFGAESLYDNYANAMDTFNKNKTIQNRIAAQDAKSNLYNAVDSYYTSHQNVREAYSPQIFLNNPSDVSFSGTDSATGQNVTTTYTKHADNYGYGNSDPSHTEAANFDTGVKSGTTGGTGFQLAFDMPK